MADVHQQQQLQYEEGHRNLNKELQDRARTEFMRAQGYGSAEFPIPAAGAAFNPQAPRPPMPHIGGAPRPPAERLAPYRAAVAEVPYRAAMPGVPAAGGVPARAAVSERAHVPAQPSVPSFFTRAQQLSQQAGSNPAYPYRDTYQRGNQLARDAADKSFIRLSEPERNRYINPHAKFVSEEIERLGRDRLREDILPALAHKFVRAGQHGSAAHRELVARAQRDMTREMGSQQRLALGQAYESGSKLYNEELMRNLLSSEMLGKTAIAQQQAEAKDIEANTAAHNRARAEEESTRNYTDAQAEEQRLWPMKMLQFWSDIMHGHPVGHTTTTTSHRNNAHRSGMDNVAQVLQFLPALQGLFGNNGGGAFSQPFARHAKGGAVKELHKEAQDVRAHHGPGDTILAHINPSELAFLERYFGGSINHETGLPQFGFFGDLWDGIKSHIPLIGGINNLVEGIANHKSFGDIMGDTAKGFVNPLLGNAQAFSSIAGPLVGGALGGPMGAMAGSTIGNLASQLAGQAHDALNPAGPSPEEQQMQQYQQYQQNQPDQFAASNPGMGAGQLRMLAQQLRQNNGASNDYQMGTPVDGYQVGTPYYGQGGY